MYEYEVFGKKNLKISLCEQCLRRGVAQLRYNVAEEGGGGGGGGGGGAFGPLASPRLGNPSASFISYAEIIPKRRN